MVKRWVLPPDRDADVERLSAALRVSPVTARILVNRGLTEPAAAQSFLQPTLHELRDPCEDPAVVAAARFLLEAVHDGRHITVFGDYDADGICGTALLMHALRFLDAQVDFYIPHRVDEGYGLSIEALRELAAGGSEVIVTVDCGVTAVEEAAEARRLGIDLIVTDHHPPTDELPDAAHVLNPKLRGATFGYEGLAGVGVAFKLVWALGQQLSEGTRVSEEYRDLLMEALSLVALGTIADVCPMMDENRVLTRYGLKTLPTSSLPGLRALIAASRPRGDQLSARDVAFLLAPRLNAAGRMGDARSAVDMLITDDERHASDLAGHLEQQNRQRRRTQTEAVRQAEQMLADTGQLDEPGCIVLSSPDWHLGIVGLVASRLADRFGRPCFALNVEGNVARGSARSPGAFPLYQAVSECSDLLDRFGGHDTAAGLSLQMDNLPAFTERINALALRFHGGEAPIPDLALDGEMPLSALNADLVRELRLLEPFGRDNPRPLFAATDLRLVGYPQTVGSAGRHLAFKVRQGNTVLRAICMGKADWLGELSARKGEPFSLAFEPSIDYYRGTMSIELRGEDIQWDAEHRVARGA